MKKGPDTPKGFRDISPELAQKRRKTINNIADTLESAKFYPLETPTIEFAETLTGKYGEEEKLIYKFTDRGGRELALRYDLTVPLARYIANNPGALSPSFSRYQIGQVFRGEKPQAGRYREFTQFDFDILGERDLSADALVIATAIASVRKLGLDKAKMAINDRENFENVPQDFVRAIDKIYKIGIEGVRRELEEKGYSKEEIAQVNEIQSIKPTQNLHDLFSILESKFQLEKDKDFFYDPVLARGLDYYTSSIFELKPKGLPEDLSIGGGGRYDKLVGMFAGKDIPAVGFSFGLDRLIEIL